MVRPRAAVGGELLASLHGVRQRLWLRHVDSVGRGVVVEGRPFIQNEGSFSIADDVFLSSCPVQSHFVAGRGARLSIGRGAVVSYGAAISAQLKVSIGAGARIGPLVVIMDSDFHVAGDRAAHAEPKPIHIGDGVVIESRVTVLRGSSIGDGAHVRSGSVVSGHIEAGSTVSGVPASAWSEHAVVDDNAPLDVRSVVMRALNMKSLPDLRDGPDRIAEWDSFGALKLLLALEKTYGVTIREEQLKSARCIADLQAVVTQARGNASLG